MDYFLLIDKYLEGTLKSEDEQELFAELSTSEALRTDLRQVFLINNSLKNNSDREKPSPHAREKVFAALSLSDADKISSPEHIKQGLGAKLTDFYRNNLNGFFIGVSSSIAVMFLIFMIGGGEPFGGDGQNLKAPLVSENGRQMDFGNKVTADAKKEIQSKEEVPENGVNIRAENSKATITANDIMDSEVSFMKKEEKYEDIAADMQNKRSVASVDDGMELGFTEISMPDLNNNINDYDKTFMSGNSEKTGNEKSFLKKLKYSCEINAGRTWFQRNSFIAAGEGDVLSDLGASFFVRLSKEFSLGVSYRRESFLRNIKRYSNGNSQTIYDAEERMNTFGLALQMTNRDFGRAYPFGNAMLGKNSEGYVVRLMTGMKYGIENNISLHLGLEYNAFLYELNHLWTGSEKIGLNLGLSYEF